MTRTIQRLVKQGYVKQVSGKDKRAKYIELTEEALKLYPDWESVVNEVNQSLLQHFPEKSQEELLTLQNSWLKQLL